MASSETPSNLFPLPGVDAGRKATIDEVLEALPHPPVYHVDRKTGLRGPLKEVKASLANLITILEADDQLEGRFRLNTLAHRIEVDGKEALTDAIEGRLCVRLAEEYRINLRAALAHDAIVTVAAEDAYHPVRDYLDTLAWDGVERLDTWLTAYCSAEDLPLHRLYARRWAVSCVARVYQPGCKVDTSMILVGVQGARKSSAFMALGGDWYREGSIDPRQTKESTEAVTGAWIFELGELDSFRRTEATTLKAFLSRQMDSFRPAYGRNTQDYPRQVVFVGTTNEEAFLTDSTGNRRYWPVRVGQVDLAALAAARDQLWAEAVTAYRAGERWWFDADEEADRSEAVAAYSQSDPWQDRLEDHWRARGQPPEVTADEVHEILGIETGHRHGGTSRRIASVLQALGYRAARSAGRRYWRLA